MKALIFDGKVVQVEAIEFPVAPDLIWIDITTEAPKPKVGWFYDGTNFAVPPPPPPAPPKSAANLSAEEIATELVRKGLVSRVEFNAIKNAR